MGCEGDILVVDDDEDIRDGVGDLLTARGFRVRRCANGRDAVAAIEQSPPDVVLLDLMMPVMTGWQVIERLDDADLGVPYVVISATNQKMPSGCALRKPIDIDALLRIVAAHCGKQASGAGS
jgi:two-component system response regulator PrrA